MGNVYVTVEEEGVDANVPVSYPLMPSKISADSALKDFVKAKGIKWLVLCIRAFLWRVVENMPCIWYFDFFYLLRFLADFGFFDPRLVLGDEQVVRNNNCDFNDC